MNTNRSWSDGIQIETSIDFKMRKISIFCLNQFHYKTQSKAALHLTSNTIIKIFEMMAVSRISTLSENGKEALSKI